MDKVMWKVSGLVFVTSSLVGLIGGLLAAPQSGLRTRKKIHREYEHMKDHMKDQVKREVHGLKGSVANVARQGNAYREKLLTWKGFSEWQQGFLEFPRAAPVKVLRWHPKDVQ
ncbi:MAG: hypothetical protein NPIRA06_12100 [Nitrospirales bacterium]|nr:MAG: hypothetical protein NPIRA06_12100 [Nitrospirales bacterium]